MSTNFNNLNTHQNFPVLQTAHRGALERNVQACITNLVKIQKQIQLLRLSRMPARERDRAIQDLNIYAAHYLAKGAKICLFADENRNTHLSFLECFGDNNPKYFRSQGGSSIKLYTKLLETGPYRILFAEQG